MSKSMSGLVTASIFSVLIGSAAIAKAETFTAETASPGSGSHLAVVGFTNVAGKYTDYDFEVNVGNSGSQMMVALGRDTTDFANLNFSLSGLMAKQEGPFKALEGAPELFSNIRAIFGYPGGHYHILTFDNSGIETLKGIRGHSVYPGPPNAAQIVTSRILFEAVDGMKDGVDYEFLSSDFAGGHQAYMDGKVDVLIQPAPLGGAIIEQFGVAHDFRLLGLSEETIASPKFQEYLKGPGRKVDPIPPGLYTGQVNQEPVQAIAFLLGVGANKNVDEEAVYQMTKAFVEHFDEFKATSKSLFGNFTLDQVFDQLPTPLHAGAVRAYREAGLDVPENLIPPEMK